MYQTKLCLGTCSQFGVSTEEQIVLFQQAGFDGFFTGTEEDMKKCRALADELGMLYHFVHAPFYKSAVIWQNDAEAQTAVDVLLQCVQQCAEARVPMMVVHAYIGFEPSAGPTEAGIEHFRTVVEAAAKENIKIAIENTEGEEYLAALLNAFRDYENVGFCWDTGHELCYNKGRDMMALYGDRLICTHLNDNLGLRSETGELSWLDDLHLLPFDGIHDWEDVARRLDRCGYQGVLTFELLMQSKPGRHDNDKYDRMGLESYLAEAYSRACRVAALKNRCAGERLG